ncbi:hypothetical protein SAMD00019534_050390 [Acytostelium subglobosum LB1]|uniref:hypothetical protein n=1 Tax=Acytostelium subglobosum LB1 TaxID=1410327 RepID=UPI0006450DA3|nr:hypothetical protein SAMD00019534_050390 [Acytostelium subglobosum LB1]GAM21864.1 hypothetical protein SAMD00019534_050390 [Acytostelium subglobosum LB1]|eukprot:XP_012754964.1 hypothetical protein SAMD00019534_050390 [Acytostelium subglobosum LB1]
MSLAAGGGGGGSGSALFGLKSQIDLLTDESQSEADQSVDMLATVVVSFVYSNKQPSLFNLLIQMLSTTNSSNSNSNSNSTNNSNSGSSLKISTPLALGGPAHNNATLANIPFQPSPNPILAASASALPNPQQLQQQDGSLNYSGSITSAVRSTQSLMFHVLNDAIYAVSQQYQKNFYIHIIEPTAAAEQSHQMYDSLLAGCLSFINHMLCAAPTHFDFERYKQLLSVQGVNGIIKKHIKNLNPHVRSELIHYQKHKTANIKNGRQVQDKQNIDQLVARLVKLSFLNKDSEDKSFEEKLKLLGFEDSPEATLMGTGVLGLRNMIYFGARYSRIYHEILSVQMGKERDGAYYSFPQVAMALTNCLFEIYLDDDNLYEIIFDQDDWFEELFSISFELFDEIWEKEAKVPEDFVTVLHKTRNLISRIKWTNPDSIQSFQVNLGNVLDEIWNREVEIVEDSLKRIIPLSDSIIGLPTNANYQTQPSGNSSPRFQKFRSTNSSDRLKQPEGSDPQPTPVSTSTSSPALIDSSATEATASSSSSSTTSPSSSSTTPTNGAASQQQSTQQHARKYQRLRQQMKSISFKKLFESGVNTNRNSVNLSGTPIMTSATQDPTQPAEGTQVISLTASQEIPASPRRNYQPDGKNEEEVKTFARVSKLLKNAVSTLKHRVQPVDKDKEKEKEKEKKADSVQASPVVVAAQPVTDQELDNLELDGVKVSKQGSLRASGTAVYQTMRKMMQSIEKKGKTIKKRVKKQSGHHELTEEERAAKLERKQMRKEKRRMKKLMKQQKQIQYESENTIRMVQLPPNQPVDRGSFQELNLSFDDEVDSLDSNNDSEDADDTSTIEELTMDDDHKVEPSLITVAVPASTTEVVVTVNQESNVVVDTPAASSTITETETKTIVAEEAPKDTQLDTQPTIILSPASVPESTKLEPVVETTNSREMAMTDVSSIISTLSGDEPLTMISSAEVSPRSSSSFSKSPRPLSGSGKIDAPAKPGSLKPSASSTDIEGESKQKSLVSSRMNNFIKGPLGTIDRRKEAPVVKSTSIKQLVSFFESKQPSPPAISRESSRSNLHKAE